MLPRRVSRTGRNRDRQPVAVLLATDNVPRRLRRASGHDDSPDSPLRGQSGFADELSAGGSSPSSAVRENESAWRGDRVAVRTYSAELDLEAIDATLSITGRVGVWHGDGFRIAADAYPDRSLATL